MRLHLRHVVLFVAILVVSAFASRASAGLISSFEHGEVIDGGSFGKLDGVGDAVFADISSYLKSNSAGEFQAVAYFDFTGIDTSAVTSATFSWQVQQTFLKGAPGSTSVYGMSGNPGLSADDFGQGTLLATIDTSAFMAGSVLSIDLTAAVQSLGGPFLGIRIASNDGLAAERAMNFSGSTNPTPATINFDTPQSVPEPASVALFGVGLLSMSGSRWRRRKQSASASSRSPCVAHIPLWPAARPRIPAGSAGAVTKSKPAS